MAIHDDSASELSSELSSDAVLASEMLHVLSSEMLHVLSSEGDCDAGL